MYLILTNLILYRQLEEFTSQKGVYNAEVAEVKFEYH